MNELEIVKRLCARFDTGTAAALGPGDDAAILEIADNPNIVVSTDLLTDGVDFLLERTDPRRIGRKALAVNMSDLAAMAAEPLACVISAAMPEVVNFPDVAFLPKSQRAPARTNAELMERLADGFLDLTREIPMPIVGGDTNAWAGKLVLCVTVFGRIPKNQKPLCRTGARPGDAIFVTGTLGGSILRHQFEFTPRVREMLQLASAFDLHAGMDISDGLTLDLQRLTQASGVGAVLDLDQIPISADAFALSDLNPSESAIYDWIPPDFASRTPLEHALGDGEDFEILFTAPESLVPELALNSYGIPVTRIGTVRTESGLFGQTRYSPPAPLPIRGYEH